MSGLASTPGGSLGGPNAGLADAFLAKYDPVGNLLWTRQVGTAGEDISWCAAADDFGNVLINGSTEGSLGGPNAGDKDAFVSKFDGAGNLLWTRQLGTPYLDSTGNMALDGSGNVFISGITAGSLGAPNAGSKDAFVSKFDPAGNLLWTRQLGTADWDTNAGVGVDAAGNVFTGGTTEGSLGGLNVGHEDVFVSKYDPAGNVLWIRQFGTPVREYTHVLAVDPSGDVLTGGRTEGSLGGPFAGRWDGFLAKLVSGPPTPTVEISADIKPGSWPNPVNPNGRGLVPTALCGTEAFDVTDIDPATILLGREGLVGGVAPIRWGYEDVCTPFEGEPCDGHELGPDGFVDLTLKFSVQELVDALALAELAGEAIPLTLTGRLTDGMPWQGADCAWLLQPGAANMDGVVAGLDCNRWSLHYLRRGGWLNGDFNEDDVVDGLDYNNWSLNYGTGCEGGAEVPEPACVVLLLGSASVMLKRRSKR